ncbi:MAG TPA: DUF1501 domain-containing protein, partial [Planctomycetota bacterium]|nr:DUF1501 domain-containing protein [Planctomycetota bacterium]
GGPSHIDTFDPKPDAPSAFRSLFTTIPTRIPGVHFTEIFPLLAKRNDRFALIRSHVTWDNNHLPAGSMGLTGGKKRPDGNWSPNFGSIVARHRASELPPFLSIGRGKLRDAGGDVEGIGGGPWGSAYDPFSVVCGDEGKVDLPALRLLDGLTPDRLRDRRRLLEAIDRLERDTSSRALETWNGHMARAFDLLTSSTGRKAFDLSLESDDTRGRYGRTAFGQSCLLARRLAEAGVPYIQVNWSEYVEPLLGDRTDYGWDTHANNFEFLNDRHGPILDRALSALLDDLGERGLLESTLVVCMGEFGRTPRMNGSMARDHWNRCYASIWAGAGVQGGRVIGESDARAEDPITDPIGPDRVGTTILELAGVNAELRSELGVLQTSTVIHELF